ncbi:head GIN domain-containing protein [Polluticoccus soli]|uniref:head GIN domain-containing protein n=1 Tax=Polluticoccus soli TaxID=3034150 RepID=UPI0023E0E738|nr:head GIN domain-containing protein [Flavipsychrobacter sp. JY13-12]
MKKGFYLFILPLILAASASCKHQFVKGTGASATETRNVQQFTAVLVEAPINAIITVDEHLAANAVQITGYSNLLPLVKTEIKGNKLRVYTDEGVHFDTDKDIEVKISMAAISSLEITGAGEALVAGNVKSDKFDLDITGAGNVTIDNINSNTFIADLSGAGSLTVKNGMVDRAVYDVTGAGEVTSFPLKAKHVEANVTGAGDVEVHATDKLNADITGVGSISYKGHPAITQNVTGAGNIEDAN